MRTLETLGSWHLVSVLETESPVVDWKVGQPQWHDISWHPWVGSLILPTATTLFNAVSEVSSHAWPPEVFLHVMPPGLRKTPR